MTREEAKAYGEEWIKDIDSLCDNDKRNLDDEDEEMYEFLKAAVSALQQEHCEDAISRQAVLDINESHHGQMPNHINHQIWQEIKDLPSVSTEKTGRWVDVTDYETFTTRTWHYECSECGEGLRAIERTKYCSECGAKMEVEE